MNIIIHIDKLSQAYKRLLALKDIEMAKVFKVAIQFDSKLNLKTT